MQGWKLCTLVWAASFQCSDYSFLWYNAMQSGVLLPVIGGTTNSVFGAWRWKQQVLLKQLPSIRLQCITSQKKTVILKFPIVRTPDLSHLATIQNELRCNVNHCICCTVFCGMILCEQAFVHCHCFEHLYVLWNIVTDNDIYDISL